jgi:beta-glucanase (GH16 family)
MRRLAGVFFVVLGSGLVWSARAQVADKPAVLPGWTLVWHDEFNQAAGTVPDASKWSYDAGASGYGNKELEDYCLPGSGTAPCVAGEPNAFQDGSGHLVIEARRNADGQWTSARVKTQARYQFTYGRVEARMKLPVGDGLWPAFWMLGADIDTVNWPQSGEVDILEWVQSYGPTTTSSTSHGPGYSGAHGITDRYTFPNGGRVDGAGFHVYGVLWSKDKLEYYRDDPSQVFLTLTPASLPGGGAWVYDHPFFLILNLAIGSGGFAGPTDTTTPQTARMLVDWVRVYQPAGTGTAKTTAMLPAGAAGWAQYRLAAEAGYCGSLSQGRSGQQTGRQKMPCDRSVQNASAGSLDAQLLGMEPPE